MFRSNSIQIVTNNIIGAGLSENFAPVTMSPAEGRFLSPTLQTLTSSIIPMSSWNLEDSTRAKIRCNHTGLYIARTFLSLETDDGTHYAYACISKNDDMIGRPVGIIHSVGEQLVNTVANLSSQLATERLVHCYVGDTLEPVFGAAQGYRFISQRFSFSVVQV